MIFKYFISLINKNPPQACTLEEDVVCTTCITIITSKEGENNDGKNRG
jgi:hypothetical protein